MKSNKVALIIGYGSIGKKHHNSLKKILMNKNIHILSRRKLNVKNSFTNQKKILELDPDYIIICVETSKHEYYLKYLLKNFKNKKILVEKPLFTKFTKLNLNTNKVFVGYNLRLMESIQYIKKFLKNKKIYSININNQSYLPLWRKNIQYNKSYSSNIRKGGGVFFDLSHDLDLIYWLFGKLNLKFFVNKKISKLNISSDDFLMLIGKIKDFYINLTQSYFSLIPIKQIFITGENFTIDADIYNNKLELCERNKKRIFKFKTNVLDTYEYLNQKLLNNNYKDICTYKEALNLLKVINKIQKK